MTEKPRTWTYEEITEEIEKQIKTCIQLGGDFNKEWAFGAYLAWNHLTIGWQKSGDVTRIRALTESFSSDEDKNDK